MLEKLLTLPQYLIPHHFLSSIMFKLTRSRAVWWKNLMISKFIGLYKVDMSLAVEPEGTAYPSFNHFFTRKLKPESRPIVSGADEICCPVDGTVSQAGLIKAGDILQAKGHSYTVSQLLGGDTKLAAHFEDGEFATLYLSPRDYHRIHSPMDGDLREMIHVPGRLFSVNARTARVVKGLFARNERVVTIFDTSLGPVALVLVGAIFVSSMETVWSGTITPPRGKKVRSWHYGKGQEPSVHLDKGDELGRFNMGSTVVLLFPRDAVQWNKKIIPGAAVRMGQLLANIRGK